MMPRKDLINMKLERVLRPMIRDLKANQTAIRRVGGFTVTNLGEEVNLQEAREKNLVWASAATDEQIQAKIADLEKQIPRDALGCKYGSVRGLPLETIQTIALIEDLEIALGVHPGVTR